MGRSGYSDDCDEPAIHLWRGAVAAATRGKRGQQFLHDLVAALDALPMKRLVAEELEVNGEVCALGSVGQVRGLQMHDVDPYDSKTVASLFGIAPALAKEIMFENDEGHWGRETPEARWKRMRAWAIRQLKQVPQ